MNEMSAAAVEGDAGLEPHPREAGGFGRRGRRRRRFRGRRCRRAVCGRAIGGTAIYYLLEPNNFSEMHKLRRMRCFILSGRCGGGMLQLWPDGSGKRVVLGQDIGSGELLQTVVPQGVWQGTRLVPGGKVALLGCTVSPGFDYADYASGKREELVRGWPAWGRWWRC